MLRVEGDERDDDEHVEADEKAGELLSEGSVDVLDIAPHGCMDIQIDLPGKKEEIA